MQAHLYLVGPIPTTTTIDASASFSSSSISRGGHNSPTSSWTHHRECSNCWNFGLNSGKIERTATVAICTDKLDQTATNTHCSDQNLGMNNFPDFDGNFPEKNELKNSGNLRIKGSRTWAEYFVLVTAIPLILFIGIKTLQRL